MQFIREHTKNTFARKLNALGWDIRMVDPLTLKRLPTKGELGDFLMRHRGHIFDRIYEVWKSEGFKITKKVTKIIYMEVYGGQPKIKESVSNNGNSEYDAYISAIAKGGPYIDPRD